MEDMDTQLRSQLEKIISERNQLSAENAARSIEVYISWQQKPGQLPSITNTNAQGALVSALAVSRA